MGQGFSLLYWKLIILQKPKQNMLIPRDFLKFKMEIHLE